MLDYFDGQLYLHNISSLLNLHVFELFGKSLEHQKETHSWGEEENTHTEKPADLNPLAVRQ